MPPLALDVDELAALLVKEQFNSYGVLASPQQQQQHAAVRQAEAAAAGAGAEPSGQAVPGADEDGDEEEEPEERMLRGSAIYSQVGWLRPHQKKGGLQTRRF